MITYGVYSPIYFIARKAVLHFYVQPYYSQFYVCVSMYLTINACIILDVCYP